jgi:hypothetical protein
MASIDRASRERFLAAIGDDRLSGFEALGRLETPPLPPEGPSAEASLYPALHRLEADGQLEAAWLPNASGTVRRRYGRRRR